VSEPLVPPAAESRELAAPDGARLHWLSWRASPERAVLLLSHGLGEHAGRYAAFARDLNARGVTVHALDHRGHGRSGGPRAYTPRFERLTDDFELFRRAATADASPGVPVFLLGHSMGGLIAIRYLQTHPAAGLSGAILSAPLLGVKLVPARWKTALSGVLSRLLPRLPIRNEIDPRELSSDPAYVRSYREDPLVHDVVTPRLYTEFVAAIPKAFAERDRITLPLLFLSPGADSVVDEAQVLRFARKMRGDVTIREYPGFHHESLDELERARPVADVLAWLDARIG